MDPIIFPILACFAFIRAKLFFPNNFSPLHCNFSARNGRDAFWIKLVFRRMNPLMQTFRRVVVQNRNRLLVDNCAGVNARIHKMHRATGYFHAVVKRLFPRFQSWK